MYTAKGAHIVRAFFNAYNLSPELLCSIYIILSILQRNTF